MNKEQVMEAWHIIPYDERNDLSVFVPNYTFHTNTLKVPGFEKEKKEIEDTLENIRKNSFPKCIKRYPHTLFVFPGNENQERYWCIQMYGQKNVNYILLKLELYDEVQWFHESKLENIFAPINQRCTNYWDSQILTDSLVDSDIEGLYQGSVRVLERIEKEWDGINRACISK